MKLFTSTALLQGAYSVPSIWEEDFPNVAGRNPVGLIVRQQTLEIADWALELVETTESGVSTIYLGNIAVSDEGNNIRIEEALEFWNQLGLDRRAEFRRNTTNVTLIAEALVSGPDDLGIESGFEAGSIMCEGVKELALDGLLINLMPDTLDASTLPYWNHFARGCRSIPNVQLQFGAIDRLYDPAFSSDNKSRLLDFTNDLSDKEIPEMFLIQKFQGWGQGPTWRNTTYEAIFSNDSNDGIATLLGTYPWIGPKGLALCYPASADDTIDKENFVRAGSLNGYGCWAKSDYAWEAGFVLSQHHFFMDPPPLIEYAKLSAPCLAAI